MQQNQTRMWLVLTKRFSDIYCKLLVWIIYISLVAISVWLSWEVVVKFAKEEKAIRKYEDKIEAHPTIAICGFHSSLTYQKDFNFSYITYQNDGFSIEDEIVLIMGDNHLQNSGKNVNLTIIYGYSIAP